jgi:ATP-dependent DNA helicase RecG
MEYIVVEYNTAKLLELIATGESETIEFKESFADEALEVVGAFANTRGGILLIGIKDSGQTCGFQIGKKTLEDIANRIQDATDPRLQPSISNVVYEKKNIIIIQITSVTGAPVSVRGRYFRRVGRTNQRMSHEEIMQRMIASTGLSWDANIEATATLEDIDFSRVSIFIKKIKEKGRFPIPNHASDQEVLRKLELIRNEIPTRAAILLFGKNPNSFFPSAFLKIGRFRSPTHIVDDRETHGTLSHQLDEALSWFRERLETEFIIKGKAEREVRWEYPLNAIREALVNVLCHRDYTSLAHSQIRLYDDHLDIWNAGSLPPALTPEVLFQEHDSMPRNRKIADAFFYTGLIERWGSGTLRIAEELLAAKLPVPQFVSESGRFRVTFYKEFLTEEQLKKMELSSRQIKAVTYAKEHGSISNSEYQKIAEVSQRTATRDLNLLKLNGVFISKGSTGRGTVYKLKKP